jgi:transposase-like protein
MIDPRDVQLTEAQADALGVPPATEVQVLHIWFIVPLKGGWRVAYRLFPRDGRPFVAEMRVYPYEGDLPGLNPGEWAVELRGLEADVPESGITSSLLNDQIALGRHVFDDFPASLRTARDGAVGRMPLTVGGRITTLYDSLLGGLGFNPDVKPRRRGPAGWSDSEYVRLAQQYLERCKAGSRSPVKDLAKAHGMTEVAARAALHRARQRGLLSRQKQGKAGGELTPRAKNLLRKLRRKQGDTKERK